MRMYMHLRACMYARASLKSPQLFCVEPFSHRTISTMVRRRDHGEFATWVRRPVSLQRLSRAMIQCLRFGPEGVRGGCSLTRLHSHLGRWYITSEEQILAAVASSARPSSRGPQEFYFQRSWRPSSRGPEELFITCVPSRSRRRQLEAESQSAIAGENGDDGEILDGQAGVDGQAGDAGADGEDGDDGDAGVSGEHVGDFGDGGQDGDVDVGEDAEAAADAGHDIDEIMNAYGEAIGVGEADDMDSEAQQMATPTSAPTLRQVKLEPAHEPGHFRLGPVSQSAPTLRQMKVEPGPSSSSSSAAPKVPGVHRVAEPQPEARPRPKVPGVYRAQPEAPAQPEVLEPLEPSAKRHAPYVLDPCTGSMTFASPEEAARFLASRR